MVRTLQKMVLAFALIAISATAGATHNIPWRPGESRIKGVGHCAKGPCMKRVDWSTSKPHRHVGGRVELDRRGTTRCFADGRMRKCGWSGRH